MLPMTLRLSMLLSASLWLVSIGHAQTSVPAPRPAPLVSPEIHADRSVTFRFKAPDATKVEVWGDWAPPTPSPIKDDNGVWTTTVGPLAPDIYGYSFRVDGRSLLDPQNTGLNRHVRLTPAF
jgi:enterochelin esterase family protein